MSFLKAIDIKIEGNMWLGSAIKITAVFNIAPTSANITIEDSAGTDQADQASMTVVTGADKVYEYTYQSSESDEDGRYEVYIRGVSGDNTSFDVISFVLSDADDD